MFLDSLNCYHIEGVGLFVYFPEIDRVIFYQEKEHDKVRKYTSIEYVKNPRGDDYQLYFELGGAVGTRSKTFGSSLKATFKNPKLYFQSQHNNDNFNTYFDTERIKKQGDLVKRQQIDYLLVIKNTESFVHDSKPEIRILRIDWAQKIIKYYGEGLSDRGTETRPIFDYQLPPYKIGHICVLSDEQVENLYTLFSKVNSKDSNWRAGCESYKQQLLLNGYGHSLLLDTNDINDALFESLNSELAKIGLLNSFTSDQLLSLLCKSTLKKDLISDKSKKELIKLIESLSIDLQTSANITGAKLKIKDRNEMTNEYRYESGEYKILSAITLPNANKTLLTIDIKNSETNVQSGADNAYKVLTGSDGAKYGFRYSQNIYLDNSINLYNNIIENLINGAIKSYMTNPLVTVTDDTPLPKITGIIKYGFLKVKFTTTTPGEEKIGYIPYTVYEYLPDFIQINKYILNLTSRDESSNTNDSQPAVGLATPPQNQPTDAFKQKIKDFIYRVLCQVYNFYNIAKTYFNFIHNDFKTDNILINPTTLEICIIDFGYAKMNIRGQNGNVYSINNIKFNEANYSTTSNELSREEGENEVYSDFIRSLNDRLYSDADIETLIWWLIFYFNIQENIENDNKIVIMDHVKSKRDIYKTFLFSMLGDMLFVSSHSNKFNQRPGISDKSSFGTQIYSKDKPFDFTKYSLIMFRLSQIYQKIYGQCKFISDGKEPFQMFIPNFVHAKFSGYLGEVQPLFSKLKAESQAGGSRKLHRKSKLKSKHNSRKYNTSHHRKSHNRKLHHRKSHRKSRYAK